MFLQVVYSTSLLELIAGAGYLLGHFLLSRQNALGWVVKVVSGSAWVIFLYQHENYIFMAVTMVVVLTMLYGFYKWKVGIFDTRTKVDTFFEIVAGLTAVFMIAHFALSGVYQLGGFMECIIVTAEILGTVLLARKIIIGWYAYIVMSLLAGALVIFVNPSPAVVLGILELASIYFYYRGIRSFSKSECFGSPVL
jgi:hypothetical protein